MAEAGAGAGAGQGAGAGAGGDGGQGAGGQGSGAAAEWHGIPATDTAGLEYIKNKGWTGPADVIKSYQGAEKLIGRSPDSLLVLPRADDADGTRAVLAKLGLPEKADAYDMRIGLPKEAKIDDTFAKTMQGILHKAGLTASQAQTLIGEYNGLSVAQQQQAVKDYELSVQADKQLLVDEWKGGFDRMMTRAETAAKQLGFTGELIDAVEQKLGYAKTYKLFAEIGSKLGEDTFSGAGDGKKDFSTSLTPAEAKQQWEDFKMDKNNIAALNDKNHPGHKNAQAKQNAWFAIMYPEKK